MLLLTLKMFEAWVEERRVANDWKDYIRGRQLNRTEIANECGFAKSALRQNPTVKAALDALEEELSSSGTLSHRRKPPGSKSQV